MQDVLRKIYLKKHSQIHQQKMNRNFHSQQPKKKNRIYKSVWEDYRPLVQNFDLQEQLKIKKQLQHGNQFINERYRFKVKNVLNPQSWYFLPSINQPITSNKNINIFQLKKAQQIQQAYQRYKINPERFKLVKKQIQQRYQRNKLKRIFKTKVISILFILEIKKLQRRTLSIQRQITYSYEFKLPQLVQRIVNGYYAVVLEQELLKYYQLIKRKIQQPDVILQKYVINMLTFMTKKLSNSTIIKDLMLFMVLISGQNSFFPQNYLTHVQASKLCFDSRTGSLQKMQTSQAKMIIAVALGIKIFCANILYRPWLLKLNKSKLSPKQIIKNYDNVRGLINGAGSIFYYIILEQYVQLLQQITDTKSQTFNKLGIKLTKSIDIFPPQYQVAVIQKDGQIFPNQKRKLFQKLYQQYQELFIEISTNIKVWLQRIINACMIQRGKFSSKKRKYFKENYSSMIVKKVDKNLKQKTQLKKKKYQQQKSQKSSQITSSQQQILSKQSFSSKKQSNFQNNNMKQTHKKQKLQLNIISQESSKKYDQMQSISQKSITNRTFSKVSKEAKSINIQQKLPSHKVGRHSRG